MTAQTRNNQYSEVARSSSRAIHSQQVDKESLNNSSLSTYVREHNIQLLLIFVIILFLINLFFFFNPPFLSRQFDGQGVYSELLTKVDGLGTVQPFVTVLNNVDSLKNQNALMQEVYKDAQNGDYFLGFGSERIIIYRRGESKVIYDGPPPALVQQQRREKLLQDIVDAAKVKDLKITSTSSVDLTAVTNVEELKKLDANFYANVQVGDVVAVFVLDQQVVLYRPSTDQIISNGSFKTQIG